MVDLSKTPDIVSEFITTYFNDIFFLKYNDLIKFIKKIDPKIVIHFRNKIYVENKIKEENLKLCED